MSNHTWKSVIGGWQRCEEDERLVGPVYPDMLQAWASEMSARNHTPGPWKARGAIVYWAVVNAAGMVITFVPVMQGGAAASVDEAIANAVLIAKAPQMHDLLAHAVQQWGSYVDGLAEDHEEGDMAEWLRDFVGEARGIIE